MTHPLTDRMINNARYSNGAWFRIIDDISKTDWKDQYECEENVLARAVYDLAIEQVTDAWEDAFQSDLEHGVRSLNDKAARELATKYPRIFAFGQVLASMRPQEES